MNWNRVEVGDCRAILPTLPEGAFRCCVTSPPYWGLRDYGVEGQLGLEATPEEYVASMVDVFRAVRRVLADDGTLWLNLGDSYASNGGHADNSVNDRRHAYRIGQRPEHEERTNRVKASRRRDKAPVGPLSHAHLGGMGLKAKDMVGIPWRVAFALQADGWWLRTDIIWSKPNPMPESVTDRPTKAHEYLFLLAKAQRYYYDADAIREPWADERNGASGARSMPYCEGAGGRRLRDLESLERGTGTLASGPRTAGRNRRTVWTIPTEAYDGAHVCDLPPGAGDPLHPGRLGAR